MTSDELARRRFLGAAGSAGLLALGAPALAWGAAARSFSAGTYALVLDNAFAGFLIGFSGGNVVADVVKAPAGPDRVHHKRLGPPHIEPVAIACGVPMAKVLHDWIKSSIEPGSRPVAKNGAIVEYDRTMKELGRRVFSGALITEVEFPACDASVKDAAAVTVTFAPQTMVLSAPGGPPLSGSGGVPSKPSAMHALRSNFRLRIQGLEQAFARTAAIDAVEVKLTPSIEVANLGVTVDDSLIGQVYAWHQESVVKGGNKPRPGVLEFLTPDLRAGVLTLSFTNLGIIRVAPEAVAAGATAALRRSRVDMYCEAVALA